MRGNAVKVAAGILSSRLVGFVREALVARYLGVGAHADVYATALRFPNLLQNLLGEQTLSAAFIPSYARMVEEGREEEAGRFAGAIFGLLLAVAGGLALLGIVLARPLVALFATGFLQDAARVAAGEATVDRYALAVAMVRIIFPMAGLLVLSAWALGILNSHRRFFLPYFAPVLWNSTIIATLLWVGSRLVDGGELALGDRGPLLMALAWGALVGGALQFAVQLPLVARLLRGFRLSFSPRVPGVPRALRAFGPVLAGRGVVQLAGYVDFFLASLITAGAVSALRFAQALYVLPISLFAMSVAAAELPELSRLAGGDGDEERRRRVRGGLRQMAFLTVPTLVGYLAFGWLLVGGVFRRGSFGPQDHWLVWLVLAGYTLGLLPTTASRLLQNLFYSLEETRYPARVAMLRVAIGAVLGGTLMLFLDRLPMTGLVAGRPGEQVLRLGALGLALGSMVGAWTEAALLVRQLRRRVPGLGLPWRAAGRMLALALAAAALAGGLWWLLPPLPLWALAATVVGGYALLYLGASLALGFPEPRVWLGRMRPGTPGSRGSRR
ncbi:MAG TPA: murein biosynthesis integral membrane protein MurJ [Thermoanaerobaculia bacterium]|nr:murein biosynthesis integral membrane protein MurJ [Thermoanaerobaculia bacterium]